MNFLLFLIFSYLLSYFGYVLYSITKEEQKELEKVLEWLIFIGVGISLVIFGYVLHLQNNIIYLALVLFSFIATIKRREYLGLFLYLYFLIFSLTVYIAQEFASLLIILTLLLVIDKGRKQFNLKRESMYVLGVVILSVILFGIQTF